jgi:hypothetical protein
MPPASVLGAAGTSAHRLAKPAAGATRTASTPTQKNSTPFDLPHGRNVPLFTDPRDIKVLQHRCLRILGLLSVVSEGTTGAPPDSTRISTAAGTTVPHGVRLTARPSASIPSKRRDLHGHYRARFRQAWGDLREMSMLCAAAERDYLRHVGKLAKPASDPESSTHRLLTQWAGWHAAEVAVWEDCSERWIRKNRVMAGVEPDYGDEPDDDPQRSRVVELAVQGTSQRTIATLVGLSLGRVNQILGGQ